MANRAELEGLTVAELREIASEEEIEGRTAMNKAELVDALADDAPAGDADVDASADATGDAADDSHTAGETDADGNPVEGSPEYTEDDRKAQVEARLIEQIKLGATTFSEDQVRVIAEKFGVDVNEAEVVGGQDPVGTSRTAGVDADGKSQVKAVHDVEKVDEEDDNG